jgi:hypothetical protein
VRRPALTRWSSRRQVDRFDRSAFFACFSARFSLSDFPGFFACPEGGALLAMLQSLGMPAGVCSSRASPGRPLLCAHNGDVAQDDGPLFSPDGSWWWGGDHWAPTLSPNGTWRWTGTSWVPVRRRLPTPRWVLRDGAIWLAALVVWVPAFSVLVVNHAPHDVTAAVGASLGTVSIVATLAYGSLLGRHGRWRDVAIATLFGTATLAVCYIALMATTAPDPTNTSDIGTGAGLVILGLPALLLVAALLGLGGVVGRLTRGLGRRVGSCS